MKTILYITVNSKPRRKSVSRTVSQMLVNELMAIHEDLELKELDLYEMSIPRLHYKYFESRNLLVNLEENNNLSRDEKKEVEKIIRLANEFKEADYYVIAAPMWNLLFPSPLKEYLDCVIQNDITVKISPKEVTGLLNDKKRKMIYVQSSGGPVPKVLNGKMNHGGTYIRDLFKFAGISDFYEINVDNTGFTLEEEQKAIERGKKDVQKLSKKI